MSHVTIYTKPYCPYCIRAVSLLEKKGVEFTEIEAAFDPEKRQEMMRRSGRATFPQIFIGDRHGPRSRRPPRHPPAARGVRALTLRGAEPYMLA
jgi:glutaredoxin 3